MIFKCVKNKFDYVMGSTWLGKPIMDIEEYEELVVGRKYFVIFQPAASYEKPRFYVFDESKKCWHTIRKDSFFEMFEPVMEK